MSTRTVRRRVIATAAALAALVSLVATDDRARAAGPEDRKEPYVGYVFPAGGCRGTSFDVIAGGQNLNGVADCIVSGEGVSVTVLRYEGGDRRLNGEQRQTLIQRLAEVRAKRRAEATGKGATPAPTEKEAAPPPPPPPKVAAGGGKGAKAGKDGKDEKPAKVDFGALPDHPLFRALDTLSLDDLDRVEARFVNQDPRRQPNVQIAETAVLRVEVDARAAPGEREIRLRSRLGLTNPIRFEVGTLPELAERESLRTDPADFPVLVPPMTVNGQILPGEVDRYRLRARRGQRLVIQAHARRLIPYLADAVPGWFQAVLSLRDAKGDEVAFADDYRFDPDPVLFCEIPHDGDYALEVRDSLYRGREDFVYRVAVGQEPFITRMFPLGGPAGAEVEASIAGWNLGTRSLRLDTTPGLGSIRWAGTLQGDSASNRVPYAVDDWPECAEVEPNDCTRDGATGGTKAGTGAAQPVDVPRIVSGRIGRAGDVDVYAFAGLAGDEVVAEVVARRLGSPLDSVLRVLDASGAVLAWNDDHEDKESGLLTHHADSYVRARLPRDGIYRVQVADAQGHGGDDSTYRLRIGPPRRDFSLVATPSSVNVPAGRAVPMWVHAIRRDGFDGDIDLTLKDAPAGFALGGARIPRGLDRVRVTLTAPPRPSDRPVTLTIEGRGTIGEREVVRTAAPSQDMMQAFAYRHLAASQDLMVAVVNGGGATPAIDLPIGGRVRVPAGGTGHVRILVAPAVQRLNVTFELDEPPAGVTLGAVTRVPGGFDVEIRADAKSLAAGYADNLIVEAFVEFPIIRPGTTPQTRRTPGGFLPAVPFEIAAK